MSVFRRRHSLASIARLRVLPRVARVLALLLVLSNVMAFATPASLMRPAIHAGAAHCASMGEHKAACPCCVQHDCGCVNASNPLPAFPAALGVAWMASSAPAFPPPTDGLSAGTGAPPLRPPIA